jgi:hypothetical protein
LSNNEDTQTEKEIIKEYWGKWIAAKVTERDEGGQPIKFKVVQHSGDRYYLRDLIAKEENMCIFYAGPIPSMGSGLI